MTARGIHKRQRMFTPTFKTVLICNEIPKVSENSYAVWRRMKVVHWPMTFSACPDDADPLTFLACPDDADPFHRRLDPTLPTLNRRVKMWPPYMATIMVEWFQWFRMYRAEGLLEPEEVVKHTRKYKVDCDVWLPFRNAFIAKGGKGNFLVWNELHKAAENGTWKTLIRNRRSEPF
jgi:hypothetical protein